MGRNEQMKIILEKLQTETPNVENAIIADNKGLLVAAAQSSPADEAMAAGSAVVLGAGERFFEKLRTRQGAHINRVLLETDSGNTLIVRIGDKSYLIIKTTKDPMLGMIFLDAGKAAEDLEKIL
ncbi:MAG: roadblock/LC7 domain-containing protein [Candidatus Omnitrophota bacterium]